LVSNHQKGEKAMTFMCTCETCDKKFSSQKKDSTICYACALKYFAGDNAPEEGDFNSALITSGEMSDQDARLLQEDLESVDHSGAEARWREMVEDYARDDFEDHRWYYLEERDEDE
jgi:hypothetical protein